VKLRVISKQRRRKKKRCIIKSDKINYAPGNISCILGNDNLDDESTAVLELDDELEDVAEVAELGLEKLGDVGEDDPERGELEGEWATARSFMAVVIIVGVIVFVDDAEEDEEEAEDELEGIWLWVCGCARRRK